jgi:hypothetical protein
MCVFNGEEFTIIIIIIIIITFMISEDFIYRELEVQLQCFLTFDIR